MIQEVKNDIKQVEEYLSKGINRPMDEYFIRYDPITFYPKLIRK